MTLYRLQASLQDRSLLPRDQYVNTIYVEVDAAADIGTVGLPIAQEFAAFYTGLAAYYSDQVKTGSPISTIKMYRAEGQAPHPPLVTHNFSMGTIMAISPLPSEVAVCLSFRSSLMPAGTKPASSRGRIYLGPLNSSTLGAVSGGAESRPSPNFVNSVVAAGVDLADRLSAVGRNAAWCVVSPTLSRWAQVTEMRCDNSWDTQRSRGDRPSGVTVAPADAANGGPATGTYVKPIPVG